MEGTVLGSVFEVFTAVIQWFVTSLGSVTSMFYASGSLTFLGVLAVAGLAVSVSLLVMNLVKSYLRFE